MLALLLPWGCGGDEVTELPPSQETPKCEREADCNDDNPCTFDFCSGGFCDYPAVPNGTQPSEVDDQQTDGDCMAVACVNGEIGNAPDIGDPPSDDGVDCLVPACDTDGNIVQENADAGDSCQIDPSTQGVCDGAGACSCAPPDAGSRHYVDPSAGTNAATHGGGPGACALQSLDYAVTVAMGSIELAPVDYTDANTVFPIVLTGYQSIDCYEDNVMMSARITGSGTHGATTASIVINSTQSYVGGCQMDGGGTAGIGIVVDSVGDNDGHGVGYNNIQGYATGIEVSATGGNADVNNNTLHDNTVAGLSIVATGASGTIDDNTFENNPTDIVCADASPNVSGGGNMHSTATLTCTTCANCSF
jgi:parallel beta-helix repeat protein